ncbi:MAG: hypothetical protein IKP32_04660 [Clostridia bacterium]|nr:hypothetical protein [Clostridia bacterium]
MNEALRMTGFAVTAAMMAMTLRQANRQAGTGVALAAGLMLFFSAITQGAGAVEALRSLSRQAGVGDGTVTLLMKLLAMAYVTEFAVQACRDAGEEGLAARAALCGKMLLMAQTLPLILEIGQLTLSLVP